MPSDSGNKKAQLKRHSMGEEPMWRLIHRFSVPAIVASTVSSAYSLINAVFVGRLGANALAAMAVTFPLVLGVGSIAAATAMGATFLIARSLGSGEERTADRVASTAITLGFAVSALVAAICFPLLDHILRALGANDDVLPLARSYMTIILACNIFSYLMFVLSSTVRAEGSPLFASGVPVVSMILNVALDPLFIFGPGRLPALGITGAAVSTVVSQGCCAIFMVYWLVSGRTGYVFRVRDFIPRLEVVLGIYRVGAASLARSAAQFIAMGVINGVAASFGVVPLAILGVLVRASRVNLSILLGLGQGVTPIISYNFGAGKKSRVVEAVRKMALSGSVWAAICWLAVMLFPTQIMSIFSGDASFLSEGGSAIRIFAMAWFTFALRLTPSFFFQGIGKGFPAAAMTLAQNLVFTMVPVLVLARLFGLTGLWVAFALGDLLAAIFGVGWMFLECRRQRLPLLGRSAAPAQSGSA